MRTNGAGDHIKTSKTEIQPGNKRRSQGTSTLHPPLFLVARKKASLVLGLSAEVKLSSSKLSGYVINKYQ